MFSHVQEKEHKKYPNPVYHVGYLLTLQILLVVIVPSHEGMARMS